MKNTASKLILLSFLLPTVFAASLSLAADFRLPEVNYPELPFPGIEPPQVFIEKIRSGLIPATSALPLYVRYFYHLILMFSGLIAFGAIAYGGFQYLIAAGAAAKMAAAREQISGGIIGLLILLSSYLILVTINPQLVVFDISFLPIEKCDCGQTGLSEYCQRYCQPVPPITPAVPGYIEIPLGRLIERVIKKSQEAREVAKITSEKAETLRQKTAELTTLTNRCSCPGVTSQCPSNCSGGSCPDPCPDRQRIDQLIKTRIIPPPPGSPPPAPDPIPGCFHLEVSATYSSPTVNPTVCFVGGARDGDIVLYLNGGFQAGPNGWNGPLTGWRYCYAPEWAGTFNVSPGESLTVNYRGEALRGPGANPPRCVYSLSCTFSVDAAGNFSNSCHGGPGSTIILAEVIAAINGLKTWRANTIAAQLALAKEYTNLRLAETLIRDTLSPAINYDSFIAIEEGTQVKKLGRWADIDISENPFTGEKVGEDPATFYAQEKGNEALIKVIETAPLQLQPTDAPVGPPSQPPAYSHVISPFPAFYQKDVASTPENEAPWQDDPINACATTNTIGSYGCGPTSLAMVIKYFRPDLDVNPSTIASVMTGSSYYCDIGSIPDGLAQMALNYGVNFRQISVNEVAGQISRDHPVITSCSTFFGYPSGHITVIKGVSPTSLLFQDTVYGERWYGYDEVSSFGCGLFYAFCNDSPDCSIPAPPPGTIQVACTEMNPSANPDLNPKLKGFHPINEFKGLIGRLPSLDPVDPGAPKLQTILGRIPEFASVYELDNHTDWEAQWPVHLAGFATSSGEPIKVASSGYVLSGGYEVVIIYAAEDVLTIKYTEDDNVVIGYTIQFQNINVDPELLRKYRETEQCNGGVRTLPAYNEGAVLGTASASELITAIRDTGAWMDPRWREDWWQ